MTPVPRETPAPPEVVRTRYPDQGDDLHRFARLLGTEGVVRGLIGPREVPRLWERHVLNCAVVTDLVPQGAEVADVGSGAGLPGLVWAVVRPDLRVTLVEPLLRRSQFLTEAVESLGLANAEVCRARAEQLHGERDFDVVTARAVAPMERLARWCVPMLRRDGMLVALKGASVVDEVTAAETTLGRLGWDEVEVHRMGDGILTTLTTVAVVRRARGAAR